MVRVNALLMLGLALGAALALDPALAANEVIDKGTYKVYQRDRALGTEAFSYEQSGDSLFIWSKVTQKLPGPGGELEVSKETVMIVGSLDYNPLWYQSTLMTRMPPDTVWKDLTRGIVVEDTAFTAYRESKSVGGEGDRFARPPGKLFILDGQVFTLFDLMCRSLSGSFDSRSVYVVVLRDEQDHVTEITATRVGDETIRWGGRPVVAKRLRVGDAYSTFHAWVGPRGYMLRLEQDGSGLRVEREPSPPLKRVTQKN